MSTPTVGDDWFTRARARTETRDAALVGAELSSGWRKVPLSGEPLADLIAIRDQVRNLAKVFGVPSDCRVDLASLGQSGAGAAGFEDAPTSFTRPYILLDKEVYLNCPGEPAVDVYCGIAVHEAAHIVHTRDMYHRLAAGMPDHRRVWENLWEDERIEALARRDAPGFAPYLDATRRHVLSGGEIGRAITGWDDLPDLDKLNTLIFAFIRTTSLITDAMKGWCPLGRGPAFDELRSLFPSDPETEADVAAFAARLEALWDRVQVGYPSKKDARTESGRTSEERGRLERQWEADREDRAAKDGDTPKAGAPAAPADETPRPGRFGVVDARRLIDRSARVGRGLDAVESAEVARRDKGTTDAECAGWDWGRLLRTTVVEPAVPTADDRERYEQARAAVAGHVAALRAAFAGRFATRTVTATHLRTGRLDRRRLAHAPMSDRLFRRTDEHPAPGLTLSVLLDESGSMSEGKPPRIVAARQVAALIIGALAGQPGIDLEVYTHTSTGLAHRDCLVRHLFGKGQPDPAGIGTYVARGANYDHRAIEVVADRLASTARDRKRVLLVVSDGNPNGVLYGGAKAVRDTRDAVATVRRRGIRVIGVGIAEVRGEEIYGAGNVVSYRDMAQLVGDIRGLLGRLLATRRG